MKKILTITAIALLSITGNKSFAQTANLNITLSDVLSFTVTQPAGLSVNFDSEAKYNTGITTLVTDHISVISSRGYVIRAKAGAVTGTATLAPGTIKLTSSIGSTNSGNTTGLTFESDVVLPISSGTAVTIVTAANTSWSGSISTNKFNVSYLIGANGVYAGKATGVNVIPVAYTVTQP